MTKQLVGLKKKTLKKQREFLDESTAISYNGVDFKDAHATTAYAAGIVYSTAQGGAFCLVESMASRICDRGRLSWWKIWSVI